ncbi:MAG: glycosyltransferase family 2 protein [Candidatus Yanofskybacteria bacterium]|nr:glycosyltransferase family 2 protein [Candidatus Yanofskybacteria bacterium]
MPSKLVSINIVVHNGEKYIRRCLDSILEQSYSHEFIELNILDNNSTDSTREILKSGRWTVDGGQSPKFSLVESRENLGMWPGQEKLLEQSHGKYIIALSVDVILDKDFIKNAVEVMERDYQIGALQAKVYKYELDHNPIHGHRKTINGSCDDTEIIDTCGFKIFKSRRIVNIGHGETDSGQYNQKREIFAVEGAVPIFRRQALEDCRLESQNNQIIDRDYFWYGDDLDLAWRMRLFGWKQVYAPSVIAWHDRKTTKTLAGGWKEFIKIRKTIPMFKRRLDLRNTTLTIIKNDFTINLLRDLPHILWRQLRLGIYFLIFEPSVFLEFFKVAKLLPSMLKRRSEIMSKSNVTPEELRQWII